MRHLNLELKNNYFAFKRKLKNSYSEAFDALESDDKKFLTSYKRLASLEAWRAYLLEQELNTNILDFFIEAQNDALLSHTFARIGSWRAALKALRSTIENVLFCLYYKDHPVEYLMWEKGKNQLPIADYINYIDRHPKYDSITSKLTGVALLKKEYSTLSKAVHASSKNFRMTITHDRFPSLMVPNAPKLNQWLSREKQVIQLINQLLMIMYVDHLQASKLRDLRKALSLVIPRHLHDEIKLGLGIRLYKPS